MPASTPESTALLAEPDLAVRAGESWVVCHTRPRCEKKLARLLEGDGFAHFLPLIETERQYGRHVRRSEKPLFPGYLFARVAPERRARMFLGDFIARIIPVDDEPLFLRQLGDVKRVLDLGSDVLLHRQLAAGKRVRVVTGPLRGLEGVVEDPANPAGIVLSVDVLRQGLLVKVPATALELLP